MPIEKFRSIEEMNEADRRRLQEPAGEDLWKRIDRVWRRASLLRRHNYPRGVFKFRSIEEAQEARRRVEEGKPPLSSDA